MVSIFWFRRDLRLNDNCGLYHALESGHAVQPIFIFDEEILEELRGEDELTLDKRLIFIHEQLRAINSQLQKAGSSLRTYHGKPEEVWPQIIEDFEVAAVYTNSDYEPYARKRDKNVSGFLTENDITFNTFKDQVIFEKDEVLKDDGDPYVVFTPYSRKWKARLDKEGIPAFPAEDLHSKYHQADHSELRSLESMSFEPSSVEFPDDSAPAKLLKAYGEQRDYPAKDGTSRLGVHLRFGTISIRELAQKAIDLDAETYLNELIWREFYQTILWHFPDVVDKAFRSKYDAIPWRDDDEGFQKWCDGRTGYPLVDAGMRELNETGYMHNRVRMLVASFLTKHLLIDWRRGEAYFAKKLLDFELASNNGGWQWAAGSGCDAAPYFRIFNPESQLKKFDKELKYVKQWVPEYDTDDYPEPMVEHKKARQRALDTYKMALDQAS